MSGRKISVIAALGAVSAFAVCGIPAAAGAATVTRVPCGASLTSLSPAAGSTLQLSRSCTYTTYLTISANNVTVTAYGLGTAPVIRRNSNGAAIALRGSGDTVTSLSLTGVAPSTWNCGGRQTPAGHVDGVDIYAGATGDTVTGVTASGFYAGVYIKAGSSGNVIRNNTLKNNIMLDTNNAGGSAGAFGVLLWGDNNTIQGNRITGNQACSLAYGHDGSAVEVFGGSGNEVTGNTASNDDVFTELGSYTGHIASGNRFDGNTVTDGATALNGAFLVTRGSGSGDGPVDNTIATGNTVTLIKPGDQGAVSYAWEPGDPVLLTLAGNYLNLGKNQVLYEDGGYVDGGGNTFIGTCNPSSDCTGASARHAG